MNGYVLGETYNRLLHDLPLRQKILTEACQMVCPYCSDSPNLKPESRKLVEIDDGKYGHFLSDGKLRPCVASPIWTRIYVEFPPD